MTRIMRIERTARNYFQILFNAQTKREKEIVKLVALSCFTVVIPAFFAIVCAISALRGRVHKCAPSPKLPFIIEMKKWFPHLIVQTDQDLKDVSNTLKLLNMHSQETRESLLQEIKPFSYLQQPRHISQLIFQLENIPRYSLCMELCAALGPLFKKWNPNYLLVLMNQLTGEITIRPDKRMQLSLITTCLETLFPPPNHDQQACDHLSTVLQYRLTEPLVELMKAAYPKPPSPKTALLYLAKMFQKDPL